jgi:hypothetical protein
MRRTKRSARATTVAVHSIFAAGAQFADAPVADRGHLDPRGRDLDKHTSTLPSRVAYANTWLLLVHDRAPEVTRGPFAKSL